MNGKNGKKSLERDEELHLCIQRFVSDTQCMMNQFSELFIGQVRRFADVCMEFSLAYRGLVEERQFLSAENHSLKDELDARTSEVEILGKELRETREENEELVRRLDCFNVNSDGQIGGPVVYVDPNRNYAVVNSMPAFPRRYSVAASISSYEGCASSAGHRELSQDIPTTSPSPSYLLTPPVDYKNSLSPSTSGQSSPFTESTTIITADRKSLSKDDIALYSHLLAQLANGSTSDLSPSPSPKTPSVDGLTSGIVSSKPETLHSAVSSSAGTFYDCYDGDGSRTNFDLEPQQTSSPQPETVSLVQMIGSQIEQFVKSRPEPEITISECITLKPSFISKTPSPNAFTYTDYLETYQGKVDSISDCDLFPEADDEPITLPVQRINSKKIQKKRRRRKEDGAEVKVVETEPPVHLSKAPEVLDLCQTEVEIQQNASLDLISIIPSPCFELNRYLLVEVSHFISPSHFYLIVNDEKVGSNAFEDFLERFQTFYKTLEEEAENDFEELTENGILFECEDRDYKVYLSQAPSWDFVTLGSFWACYIDDELDWRRVQVIGPVESRKSEANEPEEWLLVKDVDSGFSTLVQVNSLRPLTDDLATIPAFAIQASLAFIYPRGHRSKEEVTKPEVGLKPEYYDRWPLASCQLFEELTYDQILTASILQIDLEENSDTEVAQVLLWATQNQTDIFINRKLIELNYASNVADDDSWIDQFSEVSLGAALSNTTERINDLPEDQPDVVLTPKPPLSPLALPENAKSEPETEPRKLKKTRSKKRRGSGKGGEELKMELVHISLQPQQPEVEIVEPNKLFLLSSEPKTIQDDGDQAEDGTGSENLLHHDPRLSNWIIQKHSRHVALKTLERIAYLFRVTCYFDADKFIGVLPFGERRLDQETLNSYAEKFTSTSAPTDQNSPFRQFILEMTEFYRKAEHQHLRLLPETFLFDQANNRTIVFRDPCTGAYLRGHIVGKESSESTSKSVKDLLHVQPSDKTPKESKSKTLSLKRRSSTTSASPTKWIVYAIDAGRYFLVSFDNLFQLEDRFALAKPFAIVCKLHVEETISAEQSTQLGHHLSQSALLGLRFLDIDFTTERHSVTLFQLNPSSNTKPLNILTLL